MKYLLLFAFLISSCVPVFASDWAEGPLDKDFEMPAPGMFGKLIPIHFRDVPLGVSLEDFRKIRPKEENVIVACSGDEGTDELFKLLLPAHQKTFGKSCILCGYTDAQKTSLKRVPMANATSSVLFDFIRVGDKDVLVEVALQMPTDNAFYVQREIVARYGNPDEVERINGLEFWGNQCSVISLRAKDKMNMCDLVYRLKSKKEQNLPQPPSKQKRFGIGDL